MKNRLIHLTVVINNLTWICSRLSSVVGFCDGYIFSLEMPPDDFPAIESRLSRCSQIPFAWNAHAGGVVIIELRTALYRRPTAIYRQIQLPQIASPPCLGQVLTPDCLTSAEVNVRSRSKKQAESGRLTMEALAWRSPFACPSVSGGCRVRSGTWRASHGPVTPPRRCHVASARGLYLNPIYRPDGAVFCGRAVIDHRTQVVWPPVILKLWPPSVVVTV